MSHFGEGGGGGGRGGLLVLFVSQVMYSNNISPIPIVRLIHACPVHVFSDNGLIIPTFRFVSCLIFTPLILDFAYNGCVKSFVYPPRQLNNLLRNCYDKSAVPEIIQVVWNVYERTELQNVYTLQRLEENT